jgi:hypothetical protein
MSISRAKELNLLAYPLIFSDIIAVFCENNSSRLMLGRSRVREMSKHLTRFIANYFNAQLTMSTIILDNDHLDAHLLYLTIRLL